MMRTFMGYLSLKNLNEVDAPPGGAPPGGPPPGGPPGGGLPPPPPGGGGAPPPPLPMPGGGGGMAGGPPMPGAPGASSGSKKLKAYNVWDVLEKLVGSKSGEQKEDSKEPENDQG